MISIASTIDLAPDLDARLEIATSANTRSDAAGASDQTVTVKLPGLAEKLVRRTDLAAAQARYAVGPTIVIYLESAGSRLAKRARYILLREGSITASMNRYGR